MPLKSQEPGALEGEFALVAFDDQTKLVAGHGQLDPVTGFKLEGGIVGVAVRVVHMPTRAVVMVPGGVAPFGYHGSIHGEAGRVIVLVPSGNAGDGCGDKGTEHHDKDQEEHD